MRYLLWPLLRAGALVLLPIITVFGGLMSLLKGITPILSSCFLLGCLLYLPLLPLVGLIAVIHYTASRLYLEIMFLDVKLGFAQPDEVLSVVKRTFPRDEWDLRSRARSRLL